MAGNDGITRAWTLTAGDELAVAAGCYFSPQHGEQVVKFMEEFCVLSKGRWAGRPLVLLDWQRTLTMRLFGWRRPDGRRRFRRCYVEIAKKSGKSGWASAVSLYLLLADREPGAEVYINACDRDQASICFDEAAKMVQASPALRKRAEVIPSRKIITAGNSKLVANSADAAKQDGLNPSGIIFDELHRQPDRFLWEVFEYASRAREQPLTLSITTAGEDEEGVWYEQREYSEKVAAGIVADWTHLGVVYRALPEDDIDDPATWRKANPALGVIATEEDFARDLGEAKLSPSRLANFKRLRLNIVVRSEDKFIDMARWDVCRGEWTIPEYDDVPAYAGLDLSESEDLTALVALRGDFAGGFDVECHFWLPRGNIVELERKHGQPYRQWADEGLIELTPGDTIDEDFIIARAAELGERMRVAALLVDPWNARRIAPALKEKHGLPVEMIRQGWGSLNSPTKTLGELVASRKLRHRGHPILRWHASNCVAKADAAGNLKLDKSRRSRKIDGMAALVNAVAAAMASGDVATESVYEHRGILFL